MIVMLIIIGIAVLLFIRVTMVLQYRLDLNERCYNWSVNNTNEESAYDWIWKNLPGFNDMVLSTKELNDTIWLEEWQIKKLGDYARR